MPELADCFADNLRRAARSVTQHYEDRLRGLDVKPGQIALLARLKTAGTGGVSVTELADWLRLERTSLSRNLRPLQDRSWIQVEPGRDRRVRVVSLTSTGARKLKAIVPAWRAAQKELLEGFGARRWDHLRTELRTMIAVIPD